MTAATTAASPMTSAMAVRRRTSGQGAGSGPRSEVLDLDTEGIGVGRKALAQQLRIEPEFLELVIPPRSANVGRRAQPAAHASFRLRSEHEVAVAVDRSHGIDRASDDLSVVQVQRR